MADQYGDCRYLFAVHNWPTERQGTMTSAITAFAMAVGGTSLICLALMTGAERRRNKRRTSPDGGGRDGGSYTGDNSGGHSWSWFGGDHATSDSSGHSGSADSSGGGDSGGGGDGGGGDGGGGGD